MKLKNAQIDWKIPQPSNGSYSILDKLTGPEWTAAEFSLVGVLGTALPSVAFWLWYMLYRPEIWNIWLALLAYCLVVLSIPATGQVTSSSAKRWSHSSPSGQMSLGKLVFLMSEAVVQFCVIALAFPSQPASTPTGNYLYFMYACGLILPAMYIVWRTPLHVQRMVSIYVAVALVIFDIFVLRAMCPLYMEFCFPVLTIKYLLAYIPRYEPYVQFVHK